MANTYTTVTTSNTTFLSELATAMTNKYTTSLTVHTVSATDLIFTLPDICEKVVRINYTSTDIIYVYGGDAYASGTTITNSTLLMGSQTNASYSAVKTTGYVVMGTSFLLLNIQSTSSYEKSTLLLLGKATNGNSLAFAFSGAVSGADNYANLIGKNISQNTACGMVTLGKNMLGPDNKIYKLPIQFTASMQGGKLIANEDGTAATITDLYASSWSVDAYTPYVGANFFLTTAPMLSIGGFQGIGCGLLMEW